MKFLKKGASLLLLMFLTFACAGAIAAIDEETVITAEAAGRIKLSSTSRTIGYRQSFTLSIQNTGSKTVKWSTSDKKTAKISKVSKTKYKVTGVKPGTAAIKARVGGKTYLCKVTVRNICHTTKTIAKGTSHTLTLKGVSGTVRWSTSDKSIASIKKVSSKKYKVTGKKAGTATVKAKTRGKTYRCRVTVTNPKISAASKSLTVGSSFNVSVSGGKGTVTWSTSDKSIASIKKVSSTKYKVTGKKAGTASIRAKVDGKTLTCKVTVKNAAASVTPASAYGFYYGKWSDSLLEKSTYKSLTSYSRNKDGTNTYTANFLCDGSESWIDQNITFQVENVTPAAYTEVFQSAGVSTAVTSTKKSSASDFINSTRYAQTVPGIFESGTYKSSDQATTGGKTLTIQAGAGVRALKVTALKSGKVIDTIYLLSNGKESSSGLTQYYADYDLELYRQIRQAVEAQLWTSDMSNYEKLSAVAKYINKTAHYPNTDATSKEKNPAYWARWAVDGQDLYYDLVNDPKLNKVMKLQGGITTCVAAELLSDIAQEDLGLPYLYDSSTDTVASGEGVWIGAGSYSSAPYNPGHESLIYKDADENKKYIDAQGMSTVCSVHNCSSEIVSFHFNFKYSP